MESIQTSAEASPELKRRGSAKKIPQAKRFRRKSPAGKPSPTSSTEPTAEPMQWEEHTKQLDPNDPVQANRIQKRRKMIQKGKNTAGYDSYVQKIPKEKRVPRSMVTPSTPDPTLDIPTKRWQGQVRAWRVALHKYDPPELLQKDESKEYRTPTKVEESSSPDSQDSPISIMSDASRRDLNEEFEASISRPTLLTGTCNWADDSDDDDDLL